MIVCILLCLLCLSLPGAANQFLSLQVLTSELQEGATTKFRVTLSAIPLPDSPVLLRFKTSDKDHLQVVGEEEVTLAKGEGGFIGTVTATDNNEVTGDVEVELIVEVVAEASNADFNGLMGRQRLKIIENDRFEVQFGTTDVVTTESGDPIPVSAKLGSAPTAPVSFTLMSTNPEEGTVQPASLTFTPENWSTEQLVRIFPKNDPWDDGDVSYTIETSAVTSDDPNYKGREVLDIEVRNVNDDKAEVTFTPDCNLMVPEEAGTQLPPGLGENKLIIRLGDAKPRKDVEITITPDDPSKGKAVPSSVTVTPDNYYRVIEIDVVGVPDNKKGDRVFYFTIVASSDDDVYDITHESAVSVNVIDDDGAAIHVHPLCAPLSEAGGVVPVYFWTDNAQEEVKVKLSVDLPEEVKIPADVTIPVGKVARIDVTGKNDYYSDGTKEFVITTGPTESTDPNFANLRGLSVKGENEDDDETGFQLNPTQVEVHEALTSDKHLQSITISLRSKPYHPVTIIPKADEFGKRLTLLAPVSGMYQVEPEDWNKVLTLTVEGIDDLIANGDPQIFVDLGSKSEDAAYNTEGEERPQAYLAVNYKDNDVADVKLTLSRNPTQENFVLTESTDENFQFAFVLGSQPYGEVILRPRVKAALSLERDPKVLDALLHRELFFSEEEITFTPSNWNVSQTITVSANRDYIVDGNTKIPLEFSLKNKDDRDVETYSEGQASEYESTKVVYNFEVKDADTAGLVVSGSEGASVNEAGGIVELSVSLKSRPLCEWSKAGTQNSDGVLVKVTWDNKEEVEVTPTTLRITPADFNVPKKVVVRGLDDEKVDGDKEVKLTFKVASTCYTPPDVTIGETEVPPDPYLDTQRVVTVVNKDDDYPFIRLDYTPPVNLTTSESGASADITVSVQTKPAANIHVVVSVSNPNEAALSQTDMTFSPSDWKTSVVVTVTGKADDVIDGNVEYEVTFSSRSSDDAEYAALEDQAIRISNLDTNFAGFSVIPSEVHTTEDGRETEVVSVALGAKPTSTVTLEKIHSDNEDEAIVEGSTSLVFEPSTWNVAQIIELRGVDDQKPDGNQKFNIKATVVTEDKHFAALNGYIATGMNIDNDVPGLSVFPTHGIFTNESGLIAVFEVSLRTIPTASVKVPMVVDNKAEGLLSISNLVFAPDTWNIPQTVEVVGQDDSRFDGDVEYHVLFENLESDDQHYAAYDTSEIRVLIINKDNESSPCLFYNGLCANDECTVCCSESCGMCSPSTCSDAKDPCCATTIRAKKYEECEFAGQAPCLLSAPPNPCKEFGGICSDNECTLCCHPACGDSCGTADCDTASSALGCCRKDVSTSCEEKREAPCTRQNLCAPYGGICRDDTCMTCCDASCGSCGGSACTEGDKCCDKPILKAGAMCEAGKVTAPCQRADKCTQFGGRCVDETCIACCSQACIERGGTCKHATHHRPCQPHDHCCIDPRQHDVCSDNTPAPCMLVEKCSNFGGICADEACTVCCDSSCGTCGGDHCTEGGRPECCDVLIAKDSAVVCGPETPAPCMRVSKCQQYGGICADEACEVCCSKTCGKCESGPNCTGECCAAMAAKEGTCDSKGAPCVRVLKCGHVDGKCADDDCEVCCDSDCERCGGDMCELDGSGLGEFRCCPETIRRTAPLCANSRAPCVRENKCGAHGGICSDAACEVCCEPVCGVCGGPLCEESALPDACCPKNIAAAAKPCGEAPCVRQQKCKEFGGVCGDEACSVCCDEKCAVCGTDQCGTDPLREDRCCTDVIARKAPVCEAGTPAPCIRVALCEQHDGICEDEECLHCCTKGCGVCGGPRCSADPLGSLNCCPDVFGASAPLCTSTSHAPCLRKAADGEEDDGMNWLFIILIVVGALLCFAFVGFFCHRKRSENKNNKQFGTYDKDDEMSTILVKSAAGDPVEEMSSTHSPATPTPSTPTTPARPKKRRPARAPKLSEGGAEAKGKQEEETHNEEADKKPADDLI